MKKSPPRKRRRSRSGAAKNSPADAQDLDPRADGDPQLSAALKSFEALTVEKQRHFLIVVSKDETGLESAHPSPIIEAQPDPPALQVSEVPDAPALALPPPSDPAPVLSAPPPAVSEHFPEEAAPLASPAAAGHAKVVVIDSEESAQVWRRKGWASFPGVSIVMTMVCSFVLALAVMLWHRQSTASASQDPAPLPPPNPFSAAPAVRLADAPAQRLAPPPPLAPPPLASTVNARDDERAPSNDLPIELSFRRRPAGNEGEHFGRISWHLTGRLHNLSDEALAVDISVEGEQGPSYAQVSLDPDGDAEFGSNDGVEIHPNDRVTLHSAPYADVVSQVR
jgi:hypothetical protein